MNGRRSTTMAVIAVSPEVTWVVPDDITGLKFGCTFPGHYKVMQGTFSVSA